MVDNLEPIVPEGTPLPTPPVGVPPYPLTPFAVWTWDSPVIPSFYWDVYSSEQRVKMICKEIGKVESYLNYIANKTNENLIDLQSQITKLDTQLTALEKKLADEVAPPSVGSCGRFLEHVLRRHATTEHGIEMAFGQAQEPFPVFLQRLCQKFALFLRLHAASIPHML